MKSEKGFALVLTMLFAVMALAFTGALMFMTIQGTKVTGLSQRYATALDAGKGAADIAMNLVVQYTEGTPPKTAPDYGTVQSAACLTDKLSKSTLNTSTGAYQWSNCSGTQSVVTSSDAKTSTDIVATLGDYTSYTKIIDVQNTDDGTGTKYMYYTVEVWTEKTANPSENSQISFLYRVQQ
ncbi:MAG: hypothetical protein H7844_05100 [Nitrospirae bacterium YQR-1]